MQTYYGIWNSVSHKIQKVACIRWSRYVKELSGVFEMCEILKKKSNVGIFIFIANANASLV